MDGKQELAAANLNLLIEAMNQKTKKRVTMDTPHGSVELASTLESAIILSLSDVQPDQASTIKALERVLELARAKGVWFSETGEWTEEGEERAVAKMEERKD